MNSHRKKFHFSDSDAPTSSISQPEKVEHIFLSFFLIKVTSLATIKDKSIKVDRCERKEKES